jgi:hypothetical protein
MLRRMPTFPAMRTTIAALAVRGRAPAIYNHAGFVDVGILMDCRTGIRGAYDRPAEAPAAIALASRFAAAGSPGVTMPRSETTFAGRMAP